jgi:hypothetical protein
LRADRSEVARCDGISGRSKNRNVPIFDFVNNGNSGVVANMEVAPAPGTGTGRLINVSQKRLLNGI